MSKSTAVTIGVDVGSKALLQTIMGKRDNNDLIVFGIGVSIYETFGRSFLGKIPGYDALQSVEIGSFDLGKPVAIALYTTGIGMVLGMGLPPASYLIKGIATDTASLLLAGVIRNQLSF